MKKLRCLGVQQVFSGRVNTSKPARPLKINGLWGWARRCLGVWFEIDGLRPDVTTQGNEVDEI
jgi:hypothetical protein